MTTQQDYEGDPDYRHVVVMGADGVPLGTDENDPSGRQGEDPTSVAELVVPVIHEPFTPLPCTGTPNDRNTLQQGARVVETNEIEPLADKFRAFGVTTLEVDGHDVNSICSALASKQGPLAIVANTRKGCGVSFMENQMAWHYLPMSEEQYQQAVREVVECGKLSATV